MLIKIQHIYRRLITLGYDVRLCHILEASQTHDFDLISMGLDMFYEESKGITGLNLVKDYWPQQSVIKLKI